MWYQIVIGLACLGWCLFCTRAAVRLLRLPVLRQVPFVPLDEWPVLSIIVAACNEEDSIRASLESLLSQDYPALELVVVNDRSTDATPAIIDELAASDPRMKAIHIQELPDGWLGKNHALHRAFQEVSGEWFLLADADVVFEPETLRRAVSYAVTRQLDHISMMPRLICPTFLLEVGVIGFGCFFVNGIKMEQLANPDRPDAIVGVGAFNLVRSEHFAKTEGFSYIKMDVLDDTGIGMLVKQARGRSGFLLAADSFSIKWYVSLMDLLCGLEKNTPALARYQWWRLAFAMLFVFVWLGAVPCVVLVPVGSWAFWAAVAFGLSLLFCGYVVHRRIHTRLLPGLFMPLGVLFFAIASIRGFVLFVKRGGIVWRGTHYPAALLRKEQKVKM